MVLIVDPSVQSNVLEKLLSSMTDESSRRLHVIVLNDHSGLVSFLLARQEQFASLQTVDLSQSSGVYKDVIRDVADRVTAISGQDRTHQKPDHTGSQNDPDA
jgi:hypothetical protein